MTSARSEAALIDALTTKGDLIAASAAQTPTTLSVGANNTVLVANSSASTGVNWTSTIAGLTTQGELLEYPYENWYINGAAFAGYTAYLQTNLSAVHYLTGTSTANGTLNITAASGTALNSVMATGQAMTFSLLITNTTAYYVSAVQVDGSAVTPKWSGGTAPSAGNASATDIYQFTILKTGSAAFTVFAAGPIKYA
jgi:hypothetical protein